LSGTDTLAYYGNPLITAVIGFKIQAAERQVKTRLFDKFRTLRAAMSSSCSSRPTCSSRRSLFLALSFSTH